PSPPEATGGEDQLSEGVDGFQLAGLGTGEVEAPPEDLPPAPPTPPAWLDLRRPQAWILIIALMALVAFGGHWVAQRGRSAPPPVDDGSSIEAEDVRPTTPQ
ncbi:MAG: hypothetical protein AAGM22_33625, partial [Acidobacteriota bacterium]